MWTKQTQRPLFQFLTSSFTLLKGKLHKTCLSPLVFNAHLLHTHQGWPHLGGSGTDTHTHARTLGAPGHTHTHARTLGAPGDTHTHTHTHTHVMQDETVHSGAGERWGERSLQISREASQRRQNVSWALAGEESVSVCRAGDRLIKLFGKRGHGRHQSPQATK